MNNLILIVSLIFASVLYILNLPNKIEARTKDIVNLCGLLVLIICIVYRLITTL